MDKTLAILSFTSGALFAVWLTLMVFGKVDSKPFMIVGGLIVVASASYAAMCINKALNGPPKSGDAALRPNHP